MKKILFSLLVSVAFIGCEEKEPTCVVCLQDGVEVFSACIEDYPLYGNVYEIREAIDPLYENEECEYYN